MKSRYFLTDIKRLWKSYEFYAAILGVAVALLFSVEDMELKNGNVMFTYFYATELTGFKITYVFCAFAFATTFCEDLEHKYLRFLTIRGSLKKYVASRVTVIYLASVVTMVLGSMLFVCFCRARGPWVSEYDIGVIAMYKGLVEGGHYALYCACYALQLGLLAGLLSVLSAFLSLYFTNKVTVFALPVLLCELLEEVDFGMYNTVLLFRAYNKLFAKDWQCLLFLVTISVGVTAVLAVGIFRKLKTRW